MNICRIKRILRSLGKYGTIADLGTHCVVLSGYVYLKDYRLVTLVNLLYVEITGDDAFVRHIKPEDAEQRDPHYRVPYTHAWQKEDAEREIKRRFIKDQEHKEVFLAELASMISLAQEFVDPM